VDENKEGLLKLAVLLVSGFVTLLNLIEKIARFTKPRKNRERQKHKRRKR
jgi:hypothetical protein